MKKPAGGYMGICFIIMPVIVTIHVITINYTKYYMYSTIHNLNKSCHVEAGHIPRSNLVHTLI